MFGFGPLGRPENQILWWRVYDAGNRTLRHEVRVHEDCPRWVWQVVSLGSVVQEVTLEPGEVNDFFTPIPNGTDVRMGLVPSGTPAAAADLWFQNSPRAILRWDAVPDVDGYRIYYDAGLAGAVDTLITFVPADQTYFIDSERAAGTYVYNVIPTRGGNTVLAAAVDDASHEDISHTVDVVVDPPSATKIDSITYTAGSPDNHDVVISWTASPTSGVTYDVQTSIAADTTSDPKAINIDGTWTTGVTSPYSIPTISDGTSKRYLVQVRAVKSGEHAYGPVVDLVLPADNIVPNDSRCFISHIRNDSGSVKVTFALTTATDFGATITADIRHTTTSGASYTTVSAWQTPSRLSLNDGNYRYMAEATVSGLSTGNTYYFQVRGRNATERTGWSNEVSFEFQAAPAVAALYNTTQGG